MNGHKKNKLNQLLKELPQGSVATQSWLLKHKVYRQLADVYCNSGWLRKVGRGAYIRVDDDVTWTGGLYAIQKHMELPIYVGAGTALRRQGLAHFLPVGGGGYVSLLGKSPAKLPKWFREYDWGVKIHYSTLQLFEPVTELGMTEEDVGQYTIALSTPERAIMEVLYFVPKRESFKSARYLMEGLTTLRPNLVQKLLEKCQSAKVIRLFMFLAEECGHNWVDELDTSRMSLGKGKRVIVPGGRLDPIYNITVPNEPFVDSRRQMQALQNKRKKSPAVRLMCSPQKTQLSYDKEHGCFGSILYLAFESGNLPILDQLLREFKIEKRGSKGFKNSLRENWLQYVPQNNLKKQRKASNNTTAALVELVVAQYLSENGATIIDLEAWKKNARSIVPDICYQENGKTWNAEVKYIDISPEWQENIVEQIRTGKPKARSFGDGEFVNYYFGRIAEAAKQLDYHELPARQVWLIFHGFSNFERSIFEKNYLKSPPHWFKNTDKQNEILKMFDKTISQIAPSSWLEKISEIVLATCDFEVWQLKEVNRYKTKDLV